MNTEAQVWTCKALTDIWTGSVMDKKGQLTDKPGPDRLITTGLLGSIRWWFEVLVRGLGGSACDPSDSHIRCPDKDGRHCVVCELFGCTGWARKFRFDVLDANGDIKADQIKKGQTFSLRFTPLRPIRGEEWTLLDATLRLIAEYGAIGGKTVFKPSEEWGIADLGESDLQNATNGGVEVGQSRKGLPLKCRKIIQAVNGQAIKTIDNLKEICAPLSHGTPITVQVEGNGQTNEVEAWAGKRHHIDYGLITYEGIVKPENWKCNKSLDDLKNYVSGSHWRQDIRYRAKEKEHDYSWASLRNFWCVNGKYLARQNGNSSSFNRVIGRPEPKRQSAQNDSWIAGRRPDRRNNVETESKKVFSFKDPPRTFGFVKPDKIATDTKKEFEEMKKRLDSVWGQNCWDFLTGDTIISLLFAEKEGPP